jgi:hypothetical protein
MNVGDEIEFTKLIHFVARCPVCCSGPGHENCQPPISATETGTIPSTAVLCEFCEERGLTSKRARIAIPEGTRGRITEVHFLKGIGVRTRPSDRLAAYYNNGKFSQTRKLLPVYRANVPPVGECYVPRQRIRTVKRAVEQALCK